MANMDKKTDLAGSGVSAYEEVQKIQPDDYAPLLRRKDTQRIIQMAKNYID